MNYQRIYVNLIHKAQNRSKPEGYTEKHHIIPKSRSGSNDISNIAVLTSREHYVAHLLLAKIYGGSMIYVVYRMCPKNRRSSRLYAKFKEEWKIWFHNNFSNENAGMYGKHHSEYTRKKISDTNKGKIYRLNYKHSEETKQKISISNKNHIPWNKNIKTGPTGRKISEEQRLIISKTHKNKIVSESTRLKLSLARKNKSLSESTKQKISFKLKGLPKSFKGRVAFNKGTHNNLSLIKSAKKFKNIYKIIYKLLVIDTKYIDIYNLLDMYNRNLLYSIILRVKDTNKKRIILNIINN